MERAEPSSLQQKHAPIGPCRLTLGLRDHIAPNVKGVHGWIQSPDHQGAVRFSPGQPYGFYVAFIVEGATTCWESLDMLRVY
jgi:hypothetical protein